jgi:hypothetical protein
VVDDVEQRGFNQLRFKNWGHDANQRLAGENDRAFRNGLDIAGKAEPSEFLQEGFVEQIQRAEVGDGSFVEIQVVDVSISCSTPAMIA